jgi:nitronate monooxygenase
LPEGDLSTMNFGDGNSSKAKAWRDIWGSGQGIGVIDSIEPVAGLVDRLEHEYRAARSAMASNHWAGAMADSMA